jgi:hypothetical protein
MWLITFVSGCLRLQAMSFSPFQKGSSRLMLVLCPARTMERLMIGDFIWLVPLFDGGNRRKTQSQTNFILVELQEKRNRKLVSRQRRPLAHRRAARGAE